MNLSPATRRVLSSPVPLLGAWILAGILAIIVPLTKWRKERRQYYNYYGKYVEYENNQRAYEQQQRQYENQYNGNYNGNYNRDGNWYPSCSWWQIKCRQNRAYYMNANGDGNQIRFPNWYATIGGRMEEDRREREEMGQSGDEASGAVKFVYTWTLLVFIAMLIFGAVSILQRRPLTPVIVIMLIFGQFALMQLILLGQGVIATDNRDLEDSVYGWGGQLAVLMVYSDWAYFLFSIGFTLLLCVKIAFDRKLGLDTEKPNPSDHPSDYKNMNMA